MNKIKLMQINSVYDVGSTGRICRDIDQFIGDEYEVTTAFSWSSECEPKNGYAFGGEIDRKLHALMSRVSGLQGYWSILSTQKLINHIDKIKPDIVHLHNLHSNNINLNVLLNYLARIDVAVFLTLHDCWFYTGKCTHYTNAECNRWMNQCGDCPKLDKDIPSWFFDFTKKMLEDKENALKKINNLNVIGVSNWIANEARKSILSRAKNIVVLYNWINLSIYRPASNRSILFDKYGLKQGVNYVGSVASIWGADKGLNRIIDVARMAGDTYKFLLIGNVPETVILPANVIAIGQIDNEYIMADYYSLIDVYLNVSKEESFGKVVAEALSCGTPVVTNKYTANPELLGEGCGIVCEMNTEEILNSVVELCAKGKGYFSDACRSHAVKKFDQEFLIEQLRKMYALSLKE